MVVVYFDNRGKYMGLGDLLGKGMTAEVYAWGNDKVLKLFFEDIPKEWIEYEANIGKEIYEAGISAPAVYSLVSESNRKGIIYQRINGNTMLDILKKKPWSIVKLALRMAKLQFNVHSLNIALPLEKDSLASRINEIRSLSKDKKKSILDYLDRLPKGEKICHGDFHPDNLLINNEGTIMIIDWSNTYSGHPLSDVVRTVLMITTPYMPAGTSRTLVFLSKFLKKLFYSTYVKEYIDLSGVTKEELNSWILPVAAARLNEKIPGEEQWLLEIIEKELTRIGFKE